MTRLTLALSFHALLLPSAFAAGPVTLADALKTAVRAAKLTFPYARVPSNLSAQGTWASGYVSLAEIRRFPLFRDNRLNVFRIATQSEIANILSSVKRVASNVPTIATPAPAPAPIPTPVVSSASSSSSAAPVVAPPPPSPGQGMGVVTQAINIRRTPNFAGPAYDSLAAGTLVTILEDLDPFYYVRIPDGRHGYVAKKFVNVGQ